MALGKSWVANFGVAIRTNACISPASRVWKLRGSAPPVRAMGPWTGGPQGGVDRRRPPLRVMLNQQGFDLGDAGALANLENGATSRQSGG